MKNFFFIFIFFFFFSSFLHAFSQNLFHAETLFSEKIYDEALLFYEKWQKEEDINQKPLPWFHMAYCYFLNKDYDLSLKTLSHLPPEIKEVQIFKAVLFLLKGELEKVLQQLENENMSSHMSEESQFLRAKVFSLLQKEKKAKEAFSQLLTKKEKKMIHLLSILSLVEFEIKEEQYDSCLLLLSSLDVESYSLSYKNRVYELQGKIAYLQNRLEESIQFFEKIASFPSEKKEKIQACHSIGLACLKKLKSSLLSDEEKIRWIEKGKQALQSSLQDSFDEESFFIFIQILFEKYALLETENNRIEIFSLLEKNRSFSNLSLQNKANWIWAGVQKDFSSKKDAFFLLKEKLLEEDPLQGKILCELCHLYLEEAFHSLKEEYLTVSFSYLKEAFAFFQKTDPLFLLDPFRIKKQKTLKEFPLDVLFQKEEQTDSKAFYVLTFFLNLLEEKGNLPGEKLSDLVENFLNLSPCFYKFMAGKNFSLALWKKENWKEAETIFLSLWKESTNLEEKEQALLFAAKAAKNQGDAGFERAKNYYHLFQKEFPHSPSLAFSYFHQFSLTDYCGGKPEALKHLQNLPKKFPDSPFAVSAFYLMGLEKIKKRIKNEQKNRLQAIEYFQKAENFYLRIKKQNAIEPYFHTIYQKSLLEKALLYLQIAKESLQAKKNLYLLYSEEILEKILNDFPIPSLKEEILSSYLETLYLLQKEKKAEKVFFEIKEEYETKKNPILFYLHQKKARFLKQKKEWDEALIEYSLAEKWGDELPIPIEERLQIWIDKGICFKEKKEFSLAMQCLSNVINENVASNLRIEAMFLRADVYKQEKRFDLAKKQLEAITKKGGQFSQLAEQKLGELLLCQ